MRSISFVFILFFVAASGFARAVPQSEWQFLESPKDHLVFALPTGFLVYKQGNSYSLFGYAENVNFTVALESGDRLHSNLQIPPQPGAKITSFQQDKFKGDLVELETKKFTSAYIYMVSSNRLYRLSARSKTGKSPAFLKFLYSIRINGKALFTQGQAAVPDASSIISLAALKTSPEVKQALNVKDAKSGKIKYDLNGDQAPDDGSNESAVAEDDEKGGLKYPQNEYSRDLIFLSRPQPRYSDDARYANISGTVNLRVEFRSDGKVGDITVVRDLGHGLTMQAVDAARKIKFIPAQLNGNPVDITRTIQFTFTIR